MVTKGKYDMGCENGRAPELTVRESAGGAVALYYARGRWRTHSLDIAAMSGASALALGSVMLAPTPARLRG